MEIPKPHRRAAIDPTALDMWLLTVATLRVDGRRPTAATLATRLRRFWIPDETVVYAGVASANVRSRVGGYYRTPLGASKPHAGGDWIKTLVGLDTFVVWWASTKTAARAAKAEGALLRAFDARVTDEVRGRIPGGDVHVLPFANKRNEPGGWVKPHGITGARL